MRHSKPVPFAVTAIKHWSSITELKTRILMQYGKSNPNPNAQNTKGVKIANMKVQAVMLKSSNSHYKM
jgi:hypothetical protein